MFAFVVSATAQPANDMFANRGRLFELPAEMLTNSFGATAESAEPPYVFSPARHSLWWTWTAPSNGYVRLTDDFANLVCATYRGESLGELVLVPSNGNFWQVSGGQDHHIATYTMQESDFYLRARFFPEMVNDLFAARLSLPPVPFVSTGDLSIATREPNEPQFPSAAERSLWFTWTAPTNGQLNLFTLDYYVTLDVFTGSEMTSLQPVPTTTYLTNNYSFRAQQGQVYQIALGRRFSGISVPPEAYSAVVWGGFFDEVPTNSVFGNRIRLAESGSLVATGYLASAGLWYEWVAPTKGTLLPGIAQAFSGASETALSPIAAVDGGISVTQGTSIKLLVHAPVPTNFVWKFHRVATNDNYLAAETLTGDYAVLAGQNYGASREPREPDHGPQFSGRTLWYRWVAPTNGWATWRVTTPFYVPSSRVYEGTNLSRLKRVSNRSQIATPDLALAFQEFPVEAGKSYCFVVDSNRIRSEEDSGFFTTPATTFDLEFTFTPLRLRAELSQAGSVQLLTTGFEGPAAPSGGQISDAQYGVVYLDRFCATTLVSANETGGLLRWTNPPPGRYLLYSQISNSFGATPLLSPVEVRVPPKNDSLANAEILTGFELTSLGTIAGATRESNEPSHGDSGGLGSIWWKWTAPADGMLDLGLTLYGHRLGQEPSDRNGIRPSLAVYVSRNGKLVRVAGAKRAVFTVGCRLQAAEGITYYIAAQMPKGHYLSGCEGQAEIRLRLAAARMAAGIVGKRFKHRQPATLEVEVNFPLEEIDRVDFLLTPNSWEPATVIATTDESPFIAHWAPAAKGPHKIAARIYRKDGQSFATDVVEAFVETANDHFVDATLLTGPTPIVNDDVGYATRERGEARETGPPYGESVWYQWTPSTSGRCMIRLAGFGEAVFVYTGSSVSALTRVPTQVNQAGTHFWFDRVAETTYHIAVKRNYSVAVPYELSILPADAPANDAFAHATPLPSGASQTSGTLRFATAEEGEPGEPQGHVNSSAWYSWTAPTNGVVAIQHIMGGFDTRIFSGTNLQALVELTDLADPHIRVGNWHCYRVQAHEVYHVQVRGKLNYSDYLDPYWDQNANAFQVNLDFEPVPVNDAFATPFDLPSGSSIVRGRVLGASSEPLDPFDGSATGVTRWWVWTAPNDGTLSVTFSNVYVQAFRGDALGALSLIPWTIHGWSVTVTNGETLRICALHFHQWAEPFEFGLGFEEASSSSALQPSKSMGEIALNEKPYSLRVNSMNAGLIELLVQAPPQARFRVESSTDLSKWEDAHPELQSTDDNGTARLQFDTSAAPARYYRIRLPD